MFTPTARRRRPPGRRTRDEVVDSASDAGRGVVEVLVVEGRSVDLDR